LKVKFFYKHQEGKAVREGGLLYGRDKALKGKSYKWIRYEKRPIDMERIKTSGGWENLEM
jgi:hypothetical protein